MEWGELRLKDPIVVSTYAADGLVLVKSVQDLQAVVGSF